MIAQEVLYANAIFKVLDMILFLVKPITVQQILEHKYSADHNIFSFCSLGMLL